MNHSTELRIKQCSKCKKLSQNPKVDFARDRNRKDGLQLVCKECFSFYIKMRSEKRKLEKRRRKIKEIEERNKEKPLPFGVMNKLLK